MKNDKTLREGARELISNGIFRLIRRVPELKNIDEEVDYLVDVIKNIVASNDNQRKEYIEKKLEDGKLDLRTCRFGTELGSPLIDVVEEAIKSYNVTHLDLSFNWLEGYVIKVAKEVAKSEILTTLDLSGNILREYAPEVVQELAKSKSITDLDLSWNDLGEYAIEVAKEVAKSKTITHLDLSWNYLREHAIEVAKEAVKSKTITHLNLSYNHLEEHIAEVENILKNSKIKLIHEEE